MFNTVLKMKRDSLKILVLFTAIVLIFSNPTRANSIIVENGTAKLIGKSLKVYSDPNNTEDYRIILDKLNEFEQQKEDIFFEYATTGKYWFFCSVDNHSQSDLWMDINNSNVTAVELYRLDEHFELIDSLSTGCIKPNPKLTRKGYTFQLPIAEKEANSRINILFSVKTNLAYEIPVFLGSLGEILKNRSKYDYISMFFIGGIVLMLLYNFLLYFITKDSLYLFYCFHLLSAGITSSYLNNFPVFVHVVGPNIAHYYLDTWLWILFCGTGLFTIRYFNLKAIDRTFYWVIIAFILLFILVGILNLFIPLALIANVYQILAGLFYITCLIFSFRLLILYGEKKAKLYCAGWSFMMLSAIIYLLVFNGWFPYNIFSKNITYFGVTCEILIFSIALGQRISDLKEEQVHLNIALKKSNESLLTTNESLDSFNYHVSHDLKTVMNNTLALSKMIKKYSNKDDKKRVDDVVLKLEKVAKNGIETVQSFLSMGKIDNLLKEKQEAPIDVEDALEELVQKHNLTEKIKIVVAKKEYQTIQMHPKAFESIFLNLITNSIKYGRSEEPIAKFQFINHAAIKLIIYEDNGVGIDLDRFGKVLFKPFRRATDSKTIEGTGVGLYLVKKIVNGYGGTVSVESKLGIGTKFSIEIPKENKSLTHEV